MKQVNNGSSLISDKYLIKTYKRVMYLIVQSTPLNGLNFNEFDHLKRYLEI